MKENNIIHTAIENLLKTTGIHAIWEDTFNNNLDGVLTLDVDGVQIIFEAELKKELRNYQVEAILDKAETNKPVILIANRIFPKIKEYLRQREIAYLEANGNVFIKHRKILIFVDGNKPLKEEKDKTNRAFTKTGLKTIFHFLQNNKLINETHRYIAKNVGIGLGNINYIFNGLKEQGFLVNIDENEYQLIDRDKLLEKWMGAYQEKLKPDLKIGTFRFLKKEDNANWKKIPLDDTKTWWGGEPGGDLLTKHLRPEELTLYTTETRQELMLHYKLVPDDNGNVKVYKKFWNNELIVDKKMPRLLIYTDLMNKKDGRCVEIAGIIYNAYIKGTI